MNKKPTKEAVAIYRQEILQDIRLFTSQPKAKFYDNLFLNLELPEDFCIDKSTGRKGFPKDALLCAFIVMKREGFSQITDLVDYLDNHLLIAHYCGFDITKELPSYWAYDRFILNIDNKILQNIMHSQVLKLAELGVIDSSFIALDSTPVSANTKHNNPKSFVNNKFSKDNHPKSDKDCSLGVHTASNQHNEKNFEYYWGYKSHVLVDCITGLPIYELTTGADVYDGSVALDILKSTNDFLSICQLEVIHPSPYKLLQFHNAVLITPSIVSIRQLPQFLLHLLY